MTFEIIEPVPRRVANAELRRRIAARVHECSRWLRINGFKVIAVAGGLIQPRIIIQQGPLCDLLDGAADAYERTPSGARRYRYAVRFDCMVEWEAA